MSSVTPRPRAGGPAAGLPDGVFLAPMGRRFVAFLIDAVVAHVLVFLGVLVLALGGPVWLAVILWVLVVAWLLVLLWMSGKLAATPGMRLMGLQVVGLHNGRPIGLLRAFLRGLVLAVLDDITILLIVMVVLMWQHPRRQGWHDLLADSVVIEARPLAPPQPGETRDPLVWLRQLFSRPSGPAHQQPPAVQAPDARPAIEAGPVPQQSPYQPGYQPQPSYQPQPPQPQAPVQPMQAPPVVAQPPVPEPDQATRVQSAATQVPQAPPPPPPNVGWAVVLDDQREIPITRLTLFGRNPQPRPGEDDAQLIKVVDQARTVSKTHVAVNVDSRGVFVTDRGSTNGSAVTDPRGVYNLIAAEQPVRLAGEGYVISFGDHHLRLVRH